MEIRMDRHAEETQGWASPSPVSNTTDGGTAWQIIRLALEDKAPGRGLNMAHAAVTRHAHGPDRYRLALRWLSATSHPRQWSFAQLERDSNRAASMLIGLGLAPGQVLATLCGRVPELYLTALGALKVKLCQAYDITALRLAFSVGEPLHAAAVHWGREALGVAIRDTWWQTETGGIMIANHPQDPPRPGALGTCVDGIQAAVLRRTAADGEFETCATGRVGELAFKVGWPSMFRRLIDHADRYRQRFCGGWYLSGDLVRRDADGIFWFVGRADDMIKTAGHLVSPFEVESVLLDYPNVYEAGVVGVPDENLGQRVRAYICLHPGFTADEDLRGRIMAFARQRLGPALAPREIVFTESMPKNQAGKRSLKGPDGIKPSFRSKPSSAQDK